METLWFIRVVLQGMFARPADKQQRCQKRKGRAK
jgi:hypothetical protein